MSRWYARLVSSPPAGPRSHERRAPQDTEFPGVVARPIGAFKTSSDYHYQTMRCNVDLLKIIQVGLTIADEDGNYPQDVSTWQFNFHFSIKCVFFQPASQPASRATRIPACVADVSGPFPLPPK